MLTGAGREREGRGGRVPTSKGGVKKRRGEKAGESRRGKGQRQGRILHQGLRGIDAPIVIVKRLFFFFYVFLVFFSFMRIATGLPVGQIAISGYDVFWWHPHSLCGLVKKKIEI